MIVKKYIVNTIDEAQELIGKDLGPDAVILTSRHIRHKGIKALFFKDKVEIVAAVEEEEFRAFQQLSAHVSNKFVSTQAIEPLLAKIIQEKTKNDSFFSVCEDLIKEFGHINSERLIAKQKLKKTGISEQFSDHLLQQSGGTVEELRNILQANFRCNGPILLNRDTATYAAIIGVSGCGKSTVAAQIANQYVTQTDRHVAVITLEKGQSEMDFESELESTKHNNLVLIDTPSCDPQDFQDLHTLLSFLALIPEVHIYLAIDARLTEKEAFHQIDCFKIFGIEGLIFTHVDQVKPQVLVVNCFLYSNIPVSYLAYEHGTLEVAQPEVILQHLFRSS